MRGVGAGVSREPFVGTLCMACWCIAEPPTHVQAVMSAASQFVFELDPPSSVGRSVRAQLKSNVEQSRLRRAVHVQVGLFTHHVPGDGNHPGGCFGLRYGHPTDEGCVRAVLINKRCSKDPSLDPRSWRRQEVLYQPWQIYSFAQSQVARLAANAAWCGASLDFITAFV